MEIYLIGVIASTILLAIMKLFFDGKKSEIDKARESLPLSNFIGFIVYLGVMAASWVGVLLSLHDILVNIKNKG